MRQKRQRAFRKPVRVEGSEGIQEKGSEEIRMD